jgi:ferredoxin
MGLLRRGLRLNDANAPRYDNKPKGSGDCGGNGLCATCVVSVLQGKEFLTPRGLSEKNLLARSARWRQSCRSYIVCPEGETEVELRIATNPRSEPDPAD